ncbi:MAG: hypothetical protein M3545_04530 [Acidobacteriota bacterium]|nr:hypothetical protein [Acidobacteriota bacterium]
MPPSLRRLVPAGSRRFVGLFALAAALFGAVPASAQQPLSFFKNYFVTGDYVVSGVSLFARGKDGTATAGISISNFPEDSVDVLAAFLYVQTVEEIKSSGIHGAKFNGFDLGPGGASYAKALNDFQTRVCYLRDSDPHRMATYRADVLRFLPLKANGKHAVNGSHPVSLPDVGFKWDDEAKEVSGTGPHPIGASLVIVYRQRGTPLKAIVIYDGGYTKRPYDTMTQTLAGYYDASSGTPVPSAAKMTHIVGIGTPFLSERILVDGALVARNPLSSLSGALWDNWTVAVTLPSNDASAQVTVLPDGLRSDCLTYSAMVLSTNVQEADDDGLLDAWETTSNLSDPTGRLLPNLAGMGAHPNVKDIFFEIGYMHAAPGTSYGGAVKPAHTHLPTLAALNKVGEAFNARAIRVHFDVGTHYQGTPYVIDASYAKGGKSISETLACLDSAGNLTECLTVNGQPPLSDQQPLPGQYPAYPGTVGWKTGYNFLKEELGFDRGRKDIFRYALFAHSLGMPKDPCFLKKEDGSLDLDKQGFPKSDPTCDTPEFHVPRTNSGIADFPGGDMLITLGAFDDSSGLPIGTDYMQAATLMHEAGHNFELTHAGPPKNPREPNCKPNYLSVMNYLFQLRGLLDANGVPQLNYSGQTLPGILETSLVDAAFITVPYRTGWYAPLVTSYLNGFAPPATKHCDGSDLLKADDGVTLIEPPMVRVDSLGLAGLGIDWNADGVSNLAGIPGGDLNGVQDVNFNGATVALNDGAEEWSKIRFDELGGRRSPGGFFKVGDRYFVGPFSLDIGRGDIGRGDIGRGDIGRGDIGRGDIGRGDIGRGDIGRGDIGRGDIGRGDIGRGDIGRGDIGRGDFGGGDMDVGAPSEIFNGEIDFETFIAATGNAPTPPSGAQACLTTGRTNLCALEGGGDVPVRVTWLPPNVGRPLSYNVYRFTVSAGAPFPPARLPATPLALVAPPLEGPLPTTYLDRTAVYGLTYAYFVIANFDDSRRSGISNFAVIATPAPPTGSGSVTDSPTDAGAGNPDLVSGSAVFAADSVTLSVQFANLTFNSGTSTVQFALDMDQNPLTGHRGTDAGCGGDNGVLGVEYIVNFGSTFYGSQATILPFVGPDCNQFGGGTQTAAGSVTVAGNGLQVVFPRSMLGTYTSLPTFKVISSRHLGEGGFTGVLDRMTDAGAAPGVVGGGGGGEGPIQ